MKITIECTPSDAADALLHLLDGGEATADPAVQPGDEDKIVIYRNGSAVKYADVFGVRIPARGLTGIACDSFGESDYYDVSISYISDNVEIRQLPAMKGGDV